MIGSYDPTRPGTLEHDRLVGHYTMDATSMTNDVRRFVVAGPLDEITAEWLQWRRCILEAEMVKIDALLAEMEVA